MSEAVLVWLHKPAANFKPHHKLLAVDHVWEGGMHLQVKNINSNRPGYYHVCILKINNLFSILPSLLTMSTLNGETGILCIPPKVMELVPLSKNW